jgi:hypothetical protein
MVFGIESNSLGSLGWPDLAKMTKPVKKLQPLKPGKKRPENPKYRVLGGGKSWVK